MNKGAVFSDDKKYRYGLTRQWDETKPYVCFIGLNPSTADEEVDDPTIRKCIKFAKSWGYGGIYMVNLFAYRATDPKEMLAQEDPFGPDNDTWVEYFAGKADKVIAAWGNDGNYWGASIDMKVLFHQLKKSLYCLKLNKTKEPAHPLYLKDELKPKKFV
ncbi:MAG: DUF1643 domain-containing protein [Candidatus Peribacteraceae bacterium]|nr:DUF1643 domain-containing protein [Candidatus Peribacteraceae bacterium]